jgi:hypothetical protein
MKVNERRKRTTRGCVGGDGFDDIDAASKQHILQGIVSQWIGMNTVRVYIAMKCNAT